MALCCKNDPPSLVTPEMNDVERAYFEDYDSPELKWGYINEDGDLEIKNIYDDCRDFIDGIALVNLNGKWGYINKKGKTLIDHQFMEAGSFKNGLALVKDFEGKYFFIDKSGKRKLTLKAEKINEFQHGLSVCMIDKKWGAFDISGSLVIPAEYDKLKVINQNHVLAKKGKKYQLISHKGKPVNDLIFDRLYYEGSLPYVIKQEKEYFILDNSFKKTGTSFDKLESFKGKYTLAKKNSQVLLVDANGQTFKTLDYEKVEYAGEGKWKYKEGEKWGLLDKNGHRMTKASFYLLNRYKEDFIVYGVNDDSWGYLDHTGDVVVNPDFPLLWDYHNGYARYISNTGFGFLDKSNQISVSARFFELRDYNEGLARAQLFW